MNRISDVHEQELALWEENHRQATQALMELAEVGDVDWGHVLSHQESLLDALLAGQDRRIVNRSRMARKGPGCP